MSLEFENNDDIIDESEITNNEQTFIITENDINKRLDVFISEQLNITRSQIKNYLLRWDDWIITKIKFCC